MSDALCGPSNALQNFKSHTSADRTLQQDRLISRQQPGQAFRSHDPSVGILDPEFEAFQAGQPSAFAGPIFPNHESFRPYRHPQGMQNNAGPSQAGPSQAPAWAADFQNLQITSPPPFQQQAPLPQIPAWANQFQQTNSKSPMMSGYAPPSMRYNTGPSLGVSRSLAGGFQSMNYSQAPAQESRVMQEQRPVFDEAAFDAAFDAAMEDAFQTQQADVQSDKMDESATKEKVDIYPHLPLIRLALLKAIMDGSDRLLHEAALFVKQLGRHDTNQMDPIQAMLLRPLIKRLADSSRSPFAERYQMEEYLEDLDDKYLKIERNAHISPENEQLLAAYADCLWGRGQTNHLQDMPVAGLGNAASYWWITLEEASENWYTKDPTAQAMQMLTETNLFGLETPKDMQRVLDLETKAYQARLSNQELPGQLPGSADPEGLLFKMASILRDKPDVQQAIVNLRAEGANIALTQWQMRRQQEEQDQKRHALSGYEAQLNALETQNRARLEQSRLEEQQRQQDQLNKDDNELAQTAAELLGKVSHDKSAKFRNSAFLGLMRKLADREVKVEGDKMVETGASFSSEQQSAPTTWSQSGPMQAPLHEQQRPSQPNTLQPTDGQDVVDLLNKPDTEPAEQDDYGEGYLMTSPFAEEDAEISSNNLFSAWGT